MPAKITARQLIDGGLEEVARDMSQEDSSHEEFARQFP